MKRVIAVILIVAAAALLWFNRDRLGAMLPKSLPELRQLAQEKAAEIAAEVKKDVSTPPPLRLPTTSPTSATLTRAGVLQWTNTQRRTNGGLPALTLNAKLNAAAEAKVKDMFAKQYFAHESPDGKGPADLAVAAGYDYISVGENLALGNFDGDKALVQAWMDSPGHRANILNTGYREIGIAVAKGTFEGHTTWLAVQEFGRPLSDCPSPSTALKNRIDSEEQTLDGLHAQADAKKAEIDATPKPRTHREAEEYNAKVDAYNALVQQINAYVEEIKSLIAEYNRQVQAFNACSGQ